MLNRNAISPAEVDFWLDTGKYSNLLNKDVSNESLVFNVNMIRLASIRKSIANFVRILTRRNIPVYFNDSSINVNLNGDLISISAKINNKKDFDVAVGQALHEAAHTVKTDFDIVKVAYANIPRQVLKLSDEKNIRRNSLEKFIHTIWNVIEDRFIDDYVFNEAPGYRGYYVALYNKFWNCPEIDKLLLDPDLYRIPSLESYTFRIINFTNVNTDLLALPKLEDIAKTIDITNISRLVNTKDRINKAFEVVEIVLDSLDKEINSKIINIPAKLADPSDFFDFDGEKEVDVSKNSIQEISDILTGQSQFPDKPNENDEIVNKISNLPLNNDELERIDKIVESQKRFLKGDISKISLTPEQKSLLDLVEKHGIILVQVDLPNILGDNKNLKVNCIVVQKMTKELIWSGKDVFPLASVMKMGKDIPEPPEKTADAVRRGILLGTQLGRKIQIRNESNNIKSIRKKCGKINKRQLHEAGFNSEYLFFKNKVEKYKKAIFHITIDASSSMSGEKWNKTMTTVVAICKATSMIDNIHVTVSFRTTQVSDDVILPYVILAYDSMKDKFSKIKTLFPYLEPNGNTPEGLAFGAIMDLFSKITPDEENRYLLNLSDGEPFYHTSVPNSNIIIHYSDNVGTTHTKSQIDKIRNNGVEILSYFIENEFVQKTNKNITQAELDKNPLRQNFKKMYGKNAKFINVENILDLTKTINSLFLSTLK